ncbi:MAG: hypothetical protein U9O94_05350, partial [Nanoarchaeota archaeon]|nr:hypothetical protein [Nanoarchaeota archaeon]
QGEPVKERDKSSSVTVFQDLGIVLKEKGRKQKKRLWEYVASQVWTGLLARYKKETDININAPPPLSLYGENGLVIETCGGISTNKFHSAGYGRIETVNPLNPEGKTQAVYALMFYVGALSKIKDSEGLVHSDFVPRHVLFDTGESALYVIDRQKSFQDYDASKVESEHMKSALLNRVQSLNRQDRHRGVLSLDNMENMFQEGYASIDGRNMLEDTLADITAEFAALGSPLELDMVNMRLNGLQLIKYDQKLIK